MSNQIMTLSSIGTLFPSTEQEPTVSQYKEVCDDLDQSESYNFSAHPSAAQLSTLSLPIFFTDDSPKAASKTASRNSSKIIKHLRN